MSVNGSVVSVGTIASTAPNTGFIGNGTFRVNPLRGSLGIFAAYPGNPSDAQLQAMSAL
jgi:hypothetical protein